ncbi:MAG: Gfo/Idh/MocA family oxidoreductase [Planctomycetia bacterium]|nr:Gfo/Idh/MocA family oxidoreductase [Planctomycetia bacterium]
MSDHDFSRRDFLKSSGIVSAAAALPLVGASSRVHAGENNKIKVAIVGCGGRGSGALRQALAADPNTVFWAAADAFEMKAKNMVSALEAAAQNKDQIQVTPDRIFHGLDGYKKAIDSLGPGDVIILATPPVFRPLHFEYAVKKGVHIFAEKPLAVDIPGLLKIREANKIAIEKNLRVAVGLNNRHYPRTEATIQAIHDGKLGEILACWVYRCQHIHDLAPMPAGETPLTFQLKHIFNYDWLTGSFLVDALIHNIDICCWAKNDYPVEVQGVGGRISRDAPDDMLDIAAIEYIFKDGKRLMVQARTMRNVWHFFQANIQGSLGSTQVGEGVRDPRIYAGFDMISSNRKEIWKPDTGIKHFDSYQREHDLFFESIRKNENKNEIEYGIMATFVAIMGRMAMHTGKRLSADQVWKSKFQYAPNVDKLTIESDSPVMPDKDGKYFVPIPGIFEFT